MAERAKQLPLANTFLRPALADPSPRSESWICEKRAREAAAQLSQIHPRALLAGLLGNET